MAGKYPPERLRGLKPFPPGVSGNPSGRPKTKPITELIEKQLDKPLPEAVRFKLGLDKGATYGHALVFRLMQKAILGDTRAVREVVDRVEGKAVARVAGADGGPLEINVAERMEQLLAAAPKSKDE